MSTHPHTVKKVGVINQKPPIHGRGSNKKGNYFSFLKNKFYLKKYTSNHSVDVGTRNLGVVLVPDTLIGSVTIDPFYLTNATGYWDTLFMFFCKQHFHKYFFFRPEPTYIYKTLIGFVGGYNKKKNNGNKTSKLCFFSYKKLSNGLLLPEQPGGVSISRSFFLKKKTGKPCIGFIVMLSGIKNPQQGLEKFFLSKIYPKGLVPKKSKRKGKGRVLIQQIPYRYGRFQNNCRALPFAAPEYYDFKKKILYNFIKFQPTYTPRDTFYRNNKKSINFIRIKKIQTNYKVMRGHNKYKKWFSRVNTTPYLEENKYYQRKRRKFEWGEAKAYHREQKLLHNQLLKLMSPIMLDENLRNRFNKRVFTITHYRETDVYQRFKELVRLRDIFEINDMVIYTVFTEKKLEISQECTDMELFQKYTRFLVNKQSPQEYLNDQ